MKPSIRNSIYYTVSLFLPFYQRVPLEKEDVKIVGEGGLTADQTHDGQLTAVSLAKRQPPQSAVNKLSFNPRLSLYLFKR